MSSAMVAAQMPPAQGLAQSMMQRNVPFGAAVGPMGHDAMQQAAQHPDIQNAAAQVRNHAAQLQAGGMPEMQARQQAIQAFKGGQGQQALMAGMAQQARPAMAPGMMRPTGPGGGFANPLNGMFGQPAGLGASLGAGTGRMPPPGQPNGDERYFGMQPPAPGGMPPAMNTRPGPQGFSNSLNGMFGGQPVYSAQEAFGAKRPTPPGRVPF